MPEGPRGKRRTGDNNKVAGALFSAWERGGADAPRPFARVRKVGWEKSAER